MNVTLQTETPLAIERAEVPWTSWIRYCVKFGADPFKARSLLVYAKRAVVS